MNRYDIFNKYLLIKQDIVSDLVDVYNRQKYYSKKYRGNLHTDINVSIGEEEESGLKMVQIFVRHKNLYIKENITFNFNGLYKGTIKSNLHE